MKKRGKINPWVYWTPRILTIIFILFISMFALDIFSEDYTPIQIIIGLFMHLIPSFILIIALIIAWKYEIVGGVVFISAGIFYIVMLLMNPQLEWYMLSWSMTISGPAFLIGILFGMNWYLKRKHK